MLRAVSSTRSFEDIIQQIESAIIDGEYQPGDKLPPERELQAIMQTSRPTVRMALKVLEQKGLIITKTGSKGGAYISDSCEEKLGEGLSLLFRLGKVTFSQISQFRHGLETSAFELAAQNANDGDVVRLKTLLKSMQAELENGESNWKQVFMIDSQLHQATIPMAKNPIYDWVLKLIHVNLWKYYELLPKNREALETMYRDWDEMIAAIEQHDVIRVSSLIKAHLIFSDRWIDRHFKRSNIDEVEFAQKLYGPNR